MASYSQEVKNELAHKFDGDDECLRAEFVAMINVGAKIVDGRLEFASYNAAVARRFITLGKKIFPTVKPEVAAVRGKRLLKNLRYVVRFVAADEVQIFFDTLDMTELLRRTRYRVAYVRGAFLAGGNVNRPESTYFLQIVTRNAAISRFVQEQLLYLEFNAGFYQRKKEFVVWLREADSICDFLGMLGANNAIERFEVARNVKEVRAQVNRVVNMETASMNRSLAVAQRQLNDIRALLARKIPVNDVLREAMKLRVKNPTATVGELAAKVPITREGMQYRFSVIRRLAKKYTGK